MSRSSIRALFSDFIKSLDFCDIFRVPVTLFFKNSEKNSTKIGKFITFSIIGFLLFFIFTSDLLRKRAPYIFGDDLKTLNRPALYLSKNNFTLAVGLADAANNFYNDPSLFFFLLTTYQSFPNGSYNYQTYELELCESSDFPPGEFENLRLNGTYCLPNETVLKIEGYWNENSLSFFYVQMMKCYNASGYPVCKSNEEIEDALQYRYVDIYIENPALDLADFDDPFKPEIDMVYQRLDLSLIKTIEIYLKTTTLITDQGWFLESLLTVTSFVIGSYDYDIRYVSNFDDNNLLYNINIYTSDHTNTVTRKYQKIQDILAQFGGVCNILAIIGILLAKIENKFNFSYFAMNKLYNFHLSLKTKRESNVKTASIIPKNPKLNLGKWKPKIEMESKIAYENFSPINKELVFNWKEKTVLEKMSSKKNNNTNDFSDKNLMIPPFSPLSPMSKTKKTSPFKERFNKMFVFQKLNLEKCRPLISDKNRLNFSFWSYLRLLAKNKKYKLSAKEKCFVNAEKKLLDELDVINIIKKFQDIEKLKKILLTEKQLYFFEMLSNPTITPMQDGEDDFSKEEILKMKTNLESFHMKSSIEKKKFYKFLAKYEELKISSENNYTDHKILDMLDEELKKNLNNE